MNLAQGASFSFNGGSWSVTSIRATGPRPELADMTPIGGGQSGQKLVPTGSFSSPGTVEVETIGSSPSASLTGTKGSLSVSVPGGGGVSGMAVCEAAGPILQVGDAVRGFARFLLVGA